MLGVTNHSKVPLRLATFSGFAGASLFFALGVSFVYLSMKLVFWNTFDFTAWRRS